MDKEFEALEILVQNIEVEADWGEYQKVKHAHENLKQALTELKGIKEAKPSEALKDLQVIENNIVYLLSDCDTNDEVEQCLKDVKTKISSIKQALLKQLSGSQYTNIYIDEAVKPSEAMEILEMLDKIKKENAELNQHIKRWHDLLLKTGINSKGTVVDEIENYWTIKMEK